MEAESNSLVVARIDTLDDYHSNGHAYWDGDQTLHEIDIRDGTGTHTLLVVVPRGDAFISRQRVKRFIEASFGSVAELQALATKPGEQRRPQVRLDIEPGPADITKAETA